MALSPFSLKDNLVAFADGKRVARRDWTLEELRSPEHSYVLAVFDFQDDASVHADHWEHHPAGDEILCLLEGRLLAAVDGDSGPEEAVIEAGQAVIFPKAAWHRLRVLEPGRLMVITPGAGSALRPVDAARTAAADA